VDRLEYEYRRITLIQQQEKQIEEYGHAMVSVSCTEDHPGPTFTYTIGLNSLDWPELIVIGLGGETAGIILNHLVAYYKSKDKIPADGDVVGLEAEIANLPLQMLTCGDWIREEYATMADSRAQRRGENPIRVLQLVMPDRAGLFPWNESYDHTYMDPCQPPLTPDRAWPKVN
jgi:hypothetical protein